MRVLTHITCSQRTVRDLTSNCSRSPDLPLVGSIWQSRSYSEQKSTHEMTVLPTLRASSSALYTNMYCSYTHITHSRDLITDEQTHGYLSLLQRYFSLFNSFNKQNNIKTVPAIWFICRLFNTRHFIDTQQTQCATKTKKQRKTYKNILNKSTVAGYQNGKPIKLVAYSTDYIVS